jgi:transcription elongation factor Elf1
MKCPKCNSERIQFVSETTSKGFSNKGAATGCFCFGLPGLLFGFCNSGKKETREFWICSNCGLKFQKSEVEEKERKIESYKSIISSATTEELKDIEEHITKAKSNLDKADSDFMRQREKELTNNEKIIGAKKNRKILLILGIVGMLVSSIFFFYEDLTFLGFILFSLSLWDILSYKKSEERFIQKFGTKEFFELKEKKEKAVQSFKRLEQISRAKEELQTLTFNEK